MARKAKLKVNRHIESYLDYFEWNINMKSPSVMGGLKEKDDERRSNKISYRLV